jgi:hypothetical protein
MQQLSDLRMQQYAALETQPIDWETVGRLGQQILALEINRQKSPSCGSTEPLTSLHRRR